MLHSPLHIIDVHVEAPEQVVTPGEECFVQIDESGSFIEGIVELHILNPLNPLIDAALVIAKATANLIFEIGQDFKIYGKVQ